MGEWHSTHAEAPITTHGLKSTNSTGDACFIVFSRINNDDSSPPRERCNLTETYTYEVALLEDSACPYVGL